MSKPRPQLDLFQRPARQAHAVVDGPLGRVIGTRLGLLLTGPHASGKTTAARTALAPWLDDPIVRLCDSDNLTGGLSIDAIQASLTDWWRAGSLALIIVGTNRTALAVARLVAAEQSSWRRLEVVITSLSAAAMAQCLQRRCAAKGKRYRADYWTERVLHYEGQLRYERLASQWFPTATRWSMDADYAQSAALSTYLRERITSCLA